MYERDIKNDSMDSKIKHPFAITCRKCGSNRVRVVAFDNMDLEIRCLSCTNSVNCGDYYTDRYDYTGM